MFFTEASGVDQAAAELLAPHADAIRRGVVEDLPAIGVAADLEPRPMTPLNRRGDDIEEAAERTAETLGERLEVGGAIDFETKEEW